MEEKIESLVNKISAEYEKTVAFFRNLPAEIWEKKLYTDGEEWSVHEVLAHIVEAEGSFFRLFSNIAGGGMGVGPDFDLDQHNAVEVGLISGKSREEMFALFDVRRVRMIDLVRGFSPDSLENIGNHPVLGEATLGEMLRLYILHINIHIRDIRKASGERKG